MRASTILPLALSLAVSAYARNALFEQMSLPEGWTMASVPADSQTMALQIALPMQNVDKITANLMAVSTPGDPCYGEHMDRDDVNAMIQPSQVSNDAVMSWLKSAGITKVASDGHYVTFQSTVAQANTLLSAKFANYASDGMMKLRTTEYSLPKEMFQHIDMITPTTFFGKTVASRPTYTVIEKPSKRQVDASCETSITPKCIKEFYNVGSYTPDPKSGSNIAFGSFLNQSASEKDLYDFETLYSIPQQGFAVELINGGINDQNAPIANVGEADLDAQNIVGVSHPLPVREYITGGTPPFVPNLDEPTAADNQNEPYLPYYQYLLNKTNAELPQVISNSYGDDEQTVPLSYARRVCLMAGILGLRGLTIFESAGDTGVGGPCLSNDGKKTRQFTPAFPGTCPLLTAVGGTQGAYPEVAWTNGTGGFSNYFTRPKYQNATIETYLTEHISPATLAYYQPFFNQSGRAFPDVSAHSLRPDYNVIYKGMQSPSGGTSAASPVWAGIVGLINDARLRAGQKAVGFINVFLYNGGARGLNDITGGGSVGCTGFNAQTGMSYGGQSGIIPYASWNATVGWDPVTGLGTPNFQALMAEALAAGKNNKRNTCVRH